MKINERLSAIRTIMRANGLDACIIPTTDAHQSEYPADYFKFRAYLSGFTGSAGTLVITMDRSFLFTDGRYALQAKQELTGTEISPMIYQNISQAVLLWLMHNMRPKQVVGMDSRLCSLQWLVQAKQDLASVQVRLSDVQSLLDPLFTPRPNFPANPIDTLDKEYTGATTEEKIALIRTKMHEKGVNAYLLASLDNIAWLCNLRGSDILYTPVFYAYFLLEQENATLFVQEKSLTAEASGALKVNGIRTMDYKAAEEHFLHATLGSVYVCPEHVNAYICGILEQNNKLITGEEWVSSLKAVKHAAEIASSCQAHVQDGAAMVRVLRILHERLSTGITECDLADLLYKERVKEPHFRDFSFAPIVGHASHGAIVHYSPSPKTNISIGNGLTVVDSGGQFLGATTDITRTLCTGELSEEECIDYTLTLKTHIALASALFSADATGAQLDGIARHIMWAHALDYRHGTGHGVGAMLSAHETPPSIRSSSTTHLVPGMILSIEPGIYKEGKHGVRIENLYVVVEKVKNNFTFLSFDVLTLCPIDTKALRKEILTQEEIAWLNTYHQKVRKELSPHLNGTDLAFLQASTRPI